MDDLAQRFLEENPSLNQDPDRDLERDEEQNLAKQFLREREGMIDARVDDTRDVNPEEYSQGVQGARELELPESMVRADPTLVKDEAFKKVFRKTVTAHPNLMKYFNKEKNVVISKEDAPALKRITDLMRLRKSIADSKPDDWSAIFTSLPGTLAGVAKQQIGGLGTSILENSSAYRASLERHALKYKTDPSARNARIKQLENQIAEEQSVWTRFAQVVGLEERGPLREELIKLRVEQLGADKSAYEKARKDVESETSLQLTRRSRELAEAGHKQFAAEQPNFQQGSIPFYISEITRGTIQMAPSVLASLITRNPVAGQAILGSQIFGQSYAEARRRGFSPDQATAEALFKGAVEFATERIPLGELTKAGGSLLGRTLRSIGAEGLQEVFVEAVDIGYDIGILDEKMTMGQALTRLRDAGIIGAGVGGSLAITTAAPRALLERRRGERDQQLVKEDLDRRRQETDDGVERLSNIVDEAENTKTKERDPETLKEALRTLAEETGSETVFIDEAGATEYFQSQGIDPEEMYQAMGVAEQLEDVRNAGHYLEVPVENFVAIDGIAEHIPGLQRDVKFHTDDLTNRELDMLDEHANENFATLITQMEQDGYTDTASSENQIFESVFGAIKSTGRLGDADARAVASVWRAAFRTLGARAGRDPYELFLEREPSFVSRPEVMPRTDTQLDVQINRARAGRKVPGLSDTPLIDYLRSAGGVRIGSNLAAELNAMGVTPSTARGLFKKTTGMTDGDNIDPSNAEILGMLPTTEEGGGFVDRDALLAALDNETRGLPLRTPDQDDLIQDFEQSVERFREALDMMGIDINQDNETIKAQIRAAETEADPMFQPGSPAFEQWFGDSKVVDENGDPLVVYHGTSRMGRDGEFDQFFPFAHFGTAEAANERIQDQRERRPTDRLARMVGRDPQGIQREGERIIPVYLSIQNPLRIVDDASASSMEDMYFQVNKAGVKVRYQAGATMQELVDALKSRGYDGFVYENKVEDKGSESWVAFDPGQVKSVANTGAYNREDPMMLFQSVANHADRISTRLPTGVNATEDPVTENLIIDLEQSLLDPAMAEHHAGLIQNYPSYKPKKENETPEEVFENIIQQSVDNLLWLHDQVPNEVKERSHLWYDGARALTNRWSELYGIPDRSVAGVLAALSPQMDWFKNVNLAERVLDIMTYAQDHKYDAAMEQIAATKVMVDEKTGKVTEKNQKYWDEVKGKRLRELDDPHLKAIWLRIYDEAYNSRNYRVVTPEGEFADWARNNAQDALAIDLETVGEKSKTSWGGFGEIAKAISVIDDPSYENITLRMGAKHKVRNFYNNILSPNADAGDVTIDTHAVAAALLQPLAGKDIEVAHNLATSAGKGMPNARSSALTGVQGTYGIFAEAYRRAAAERGILPREMQSITWEAVRGLFTPAYKSNQQNKDTISQIWYDHADGKISIDDAREQINGEAGGINDPEWYGQSGSDNFIDAPLRDSSYESELSRDSLSERDRGTAPGGTGSGVAAFDPATLGGLEGSFSDASVFFQAQSLNPANDQQNAFNDRLDAWLNATDKERRDKIPSSIVVGDLPEVLRMSGIEGENIQISQAVLRKVLEDKHSLTPRNMKEILFHLADPILMYQRTDQNGNVMDVQAVLNLTDGEGENVKVGFNPKTGAIKTIHGFRRLENIPKDEEGSGIEAYLQTSAERGNILYVDRVAAKEMEARRGINLPAWRTILSNNPNAQVKQNLQKRQERERHFQGDEKHKGSFSITPDRAKRVISLFEQSDVSTFLHESGHFFLEVMRDMAMDPTTAGAFEADNKILLNWLGVESFDQIETVHHEKFARGMEAYFFEGKAPTKELRGAFRRFADWLMSIYKDIRNLNVEMTPEITAVMDRLLATDEEIAMAQMQDSYRMNLNPEIFPNDQARERYEAKYEQSVENARQRLLKRLLRDIKKEKTGEYMLALERMKDTVREEYNDRPWWRAINYLRFGEYLDRETPGDHVAVKLFKDDVVDLIGQDGMALLPGRGRTGIYTTDKDKSIPIEAASAMFGFSSGSEMLDYIMQAAQVTINEDGSRSVKYPKMQDAIDLEAKQRLDEEMGMSLDPLRIRAEAMDALHNTDRGEFLVEELRLLRQMDADAEFTTAAERTVADEGAQTVQDRRDDITDAEEQMAAAPGGENIAEFQAARARQEASRLQRRAERASARDTREMQRIPPAVVREAARRHVQQMTIKELNSPHKFSQAELKAAKRAELAIAKRDFAAAAEHKWQQLWNHYIFIEAQKAITARDKATKEFARLRKITDMRKANMDGDHLRYIQTILAAYGLGPSDINTDQAIGTLAAIDAWATNLNENTGAGIVIPVEIIEDPKNSEEMTFEQFMLLRDAVKSMAKSGRESSKEAKRIFDEMMTELEEHIYANNKERKPAEFFNEPFRKSAEFIGGLMASFRKAESISRELDGFEELGPMWRNLVLPISEANSAAAKMRYDNMLAMKEIMQIYEGRKKNHFTKKTFIPAINASMSKDRILAVALNAGNAYNRETLTNGFGWNDAQIDAILNELDQTDWQFVQAVWDHVDSFWPQIKAVEERVTGFAPPKVEADPVILNGYEVARGGYYPIKFDFKENIKTYDRTQTEQEKALYSGTLSNAATSHGFTKARVANRDQKLDLTLGPLFQHLDGVIHDVTHREAVIAVNKVLKSPRVRQAIHDTRGRLAVRELENWLKHVAAGDVDPVENWDQLLRHVRFGVSIAEMGFSLRTVLVQPFGFTNSVSQLGAKYALAGVKTAFADPSFTFEHVFTLSPMMRARAATFDQNARDQLTRMKPGGTMDQFRNAAFWMVSKADLYVAMPTWIGAYKKVMDGAVDGVPANEPDAIAFADMQVRRTQGSGEPMNLASVQTGKEHKRLFTAFFTFFSAHYQMQAEEAKKFGRKPSADAAIKFVYHNLMLTILPAVLSSYILDGGPDEEKEESWWAWVAKLSASFAIGGMPFLRDLVQGMLSDFGFSGPPLMRLGQMGVQTSGAWKDGELSRSETKNAWMFLSYLAKLPGRQVVRTVDYFERYMDGQTQGFDPYQAFVVGYKEKRERNR
jgi:hypothetical protein